MNRLHSLPVCSYIIRTLKGYPIFKKFYFSIYSISSSVIECSLSDMKGVYGGQNSLNDIESSVGFGNNVM